VAAVIGTPALVSWDALTATPGSQSVTVEAGASGFYMFYTWYAAGGGGLATATLAGAPPDQTFEIPAVATDNPCAGVAVWYDPPSGSQTLAVTWDSAPSEGPLTAVCSVEDGNNTAWRDADAAQIAGGTPQTVTLTTVSGDLVLVFDQSYTAVPSNEAGYTSLLTVGPSLNEGGRLRSIVASGATQSATTQDTNYSSIVGISIPDDAGGGGGADLVVPSAPAQRNRRKSGRYL
jgi:hypothetical protein